MSTLSLALNNPAQLSYQEAGGKETNQAVLSLRMGQQRHVIGYANATN